MNRLPQEILELILANLPLVDLLQSYSFVNRQWYQTISRRNFIPWKKIYFAYLSLRDERSKTYLRDICSVHKITCAENCLHGLLHFFMCTERMHNKKTLGLIRSRHQLARLSEKLIQELFHITKYNNLNLSVTWGVTGMICVISHDMWGVLKLINILTDYNSDCTIMEAMEKLYCLSTFFLYFAREFQIPSRLHYNLMYAINLFENSCNIPISVINSLASQNQDYQQSAHKAVIKMQQALTHEQSRIVNHEIKTEHLIKIVAFAGSGKTTTLLRFTEKNPKVNFLLIVYNRAVANDASRKFPSNVKCKTVHQLAYRHIVIGPFRTNKILSDIYPTDLVELKILRDRPGARRYQREKLVIDTLNHFWCSADEYITVEHTPTKIIKHSQDHNGLVTEKILTVQDRRELMEDAKLVWNVIKNPNQTVLGKLPHDAYLKLWQLTKPNIFRSEEVDCVMVDEGQDMNGAMLDVFLTNPGPRVIVGDPNQQIYRWRYAVNALDKVPATHTFYLTKSFRFGPEIGFMANSCLNFLNNVNDRYLVGGNVRDSLGSTIRNPASLVDGRSQHQMCFLARTNLALFKKAVQVLGCDVPGNSQRQLPRISFAGGLKSMQFGSYIDILNFKRREYHQIKNPFLKNKKRFPNYESFVTYVGAVDDREWGMKIAVVNWAGDKIEHYVESIKKAHVEMHEADVVFSTAHRAKGMEWDEVFILDDFVPSLRTCQIDEEEQEERNLLYVAVSRAKRNLVINPAAYYTLLAVGERFERVVDTEAYVDDRILSCMNCQEFLPGKCKARSSSLCTIPLSVMTVNTEMEMASEKGVLCTLCAGLPWYTYHRFSCYDTELPAIRVKDDKGHLAFRFLVGPIAQEKEMAEVHYAQQRLLMLDGFIQARHLALPRPPLVVNDQEPVFPEDDVLVLQAMDAMERAESPRRDEENAKNVEKFRAIAGALDDQHDNRFPDDDDIFPVDKSQEELLSESLKENMIQSQQSLFPSDDSEFDDLEF